MTPLQIIKTITILMAICIIIGLGFVIYGLAMKPKSTWLSDEYSLTVDVEHAVDDSRHTISNGLLIITNKGIDENKIISIDLRTGKRLGTVFLRQKQ